jgi:hypothetical protein
MSDVGRALREYVTADEPPIGLRGPQVVAAGRRARRNRRLATAGGALFVVVALAAGLATASRLWDHDELARRGDGFAALPACPERPGPRPATPVEPDRPIPADVQAWALPTVTCYLADRVPQLLPAARFAPLPAPLMGPDPGPLEAVVLDGKRIDAVALVRDDAGTGDLHLLISKAQPTLLAQRRDTCSTDTRCTVTTTTDGAKVLAWVHPRPPGTGHALNVVEVFRGQTHIVILASDSDQTMLAREPVSTRPTPVLTAEQVTELALGPELLLFP